mmetsp:Transcript_45202/g.114443  ORF Transcript_45202/g.114443 Transcript_45202/m.114443 type:complete len:227 (-) Transcript_45202:23-703(-)
MDTSLTLPDHIQGRCRLHIICPVWSCSVCRTATHCAQWMRYFSAQGVLHSTCTCSLRFIRHCCTPSRSDFTLSAPEGHNGERQAPLCTCSSRSAPSMTQIDSLPPRVFPSQDCVVLPGVQIWIFEYADRYIPWPHALLSTRPCGERPELCRSGLLTYRLASIILRTLCIYLKGMCRLPCIYSLRGEGGGYPSGTAEFTYLALRQPTSWGTTIVVGLTPSPPGRSFD